MVNTYEYDSHKNVTKETEKTSLPSFGFIISESETTYVNEYDALGNPVKITGTTTSKYGTDVDIQHLYWSTGSASVDAITAAMKKGKGIFDLNGRKMNMPFSRKGIYVVDGKKVFVK